MFISSSDIACFLYCPYILTKSKAKEIVLSTLTPFEEQMRKAIKDAERVCLFKNLEITTKKIIRSWDKIWWPYVSEHDIDFKTAKTLSIKACEKFADYCNYEISDMLHAPAGIDIHYTKQISTATIKSSIDIIKVNLSDSNRNTILIDLGRKGMSRRDIALDPDTRTKAYCFYQHKGETITYINIDLNADNQKLHVQSAIFRPSDMENIRRMITLAKVGIENQVDYMNRWNCKECKLCRNLKL
jgi:hypothetical protein